MKHVIAIALLSIYLAGSAVQAKLPSVCKGKDKCASQPATTQVPTKNQFALLQRDILWARLAAQILQSACSSHVFLPLAKMPVQESTVQQELKIMQSSLKSAERTLCAHKRTKHANPQVQKLLRKTWAEVDYMFFQADSKLHVMQMFASTITPGNDSEEELFDSLENYGRNAAQFNELLEEVKVKVAIIEALGELE